MQTYRKAAFTLMCAFGLLPATVIAQPALAEPAGEVNLLVNGGFEHTWRVAPHLLETFLDNARQRGPQYDGEDPLLPARWRWDSDRSTQFRLLPDARTAGHALHIRTPGGNNSGWAELGFIEVVPGGRYAFGAWTRGKGGGRIEIVGKAFEGPRVLETVELDVGGDWSETRGEVAIPGYIRQISLRIVVAGESDLQIDDCFFSAPLSDPGEISGLLDRAVEADEHTLLRISFDEEGEDTHYLLNSAAAVVDEGRFGRGLRLHPGSVDSLVVPVHFEWPEAGTLDFWAAPDHPGRSIHLLQMESGSGQIIHRLAADTSNQVRLSWLVETAGGRQNHSIGADSRISRNFIRPGQWLHLAFSWDREAVRYYINGMLVDLSPAVPMQSPALLRFGARHSAQSWSGQVDEIRISSVPRYGPFLPMGTAWTPLPRPASETKEEVATATVMAEAPLPDFAAERRKRLSPVPEAPEDAVVFDAERMRPLLDDDPHFRVQADHPVPGVNAARIGSNAAMIGAPENVGGYWRLEDIAPGEYTLGLWYGAGSPAVYLNGRVVQFTTQSDPVQVAPGVYLTELQSQERVFLQPGDEIAVLHLSHRGESQLHRLVLYPDEPVRGRNWSSVHYENSMFRKHTALSLTVEASFLAAEGRPMRVPHHPFRIEQETNTPDDLRRDADGSQALVACRIGNPLSVPLTVEYEATIRGYFREVVGTDRAVLTLQPHEAVTRQIPFAVRPDSTRYSIEADVRAVDPPDLGWPEDTVSFFPGHRQNLPFPDPFTAREERSLRFSGMQEGPRRQMRLGGRWESAFSLDLAPPMPAPDDAEWVGRNVPFSYGQCRTDNLTPQPHGVYVRRTFRLPEGGDAESYRLVIESVTDEATAYVNGIQVGNLRGMSAPLVCDITRAVRPGENEIVIVVRGILALMNPEYVNPDNPVPNRDYLDAPGLFSNRIAGAAAGFGLGDVWIEAMPAVSSRNLRALPSVRRGELAARFDVANYGGADAELQISARVLDAGEPVLDLGQRELSLAPGASLPQEFVRAWSDPELWGPGHPKLYTLAVEVRDRDSGRVLDLHRVRFGFRESWVEGGRLLFNGQPIRPKGSTVHGGNGLRKDDVQLTRTARWPDFMDEFGHLATQTHGGISNTSSQHNVDRDAFWETAWRNILAGIILQANHPSIIAWDLSNEWLGFLDYSGADPMRGARRFHALAQAVEQQDPTRWVMFNGDGDLRGLHNIYSSHYMLEGTHRHPTRDYGFHGRANTFPDGAFFRPLDEPFVEGQKVRISGRREIFHEYGGDTVLMNTENLWKVGAYMPPGLSRYVGDENVLSPAFDAGRGPVLWFWKQNIDGHRDLGVSQVANYTQVTGAARRGHMLQCFIMPDHTRRAFAGDAIRRDYSLHNDLFEPSDFVFRWALLDPEGRPVAHGEDARRMESGDLQRGALDLELPAVAARTRYVLNLRLYADGQFAYGEERPVEVWPREMAAPATGGRPLFVYDPGGDTADVLARAGLEFTGLDALNAPDNAQSVLVIGAGAVSRETRANGLAAYVRSGGRVLVLEQEHLLPGLPVNTLLETREWSSVVFPRTPRHPVLSERDPEDFIFWAPDHVVSRGAYAKPAGGPAVALVDSGGAQGMEWSQVMEVYDGRGLYLLNQLPLVEKFDHEPMAREVLGDTLAYLTGQQPFRAPRKTLQVLARTGSPLLRKIEESGIRHRLLSPGAELDEDAVLLVEAAGIGQEFEVPEGWLETALEQGADLLVYGAGPEQAGWLTGLAGQPVEIAVQPYRRWEGRAYRSRLSDLTPGLSHLDLYWKRFVGSEQAGAQAHDPTLKIEDIIAWSVFAEDAREHVFPGGLLELPVGAGRLLVNQVRWHSDHEQLQRQSARVLASLALGLDVAIEPYRPPRALPDRVAYRPLDLTPFSNRGFIDEVGGDGRGGWTDQGPDLDLRDFPTGRQRFGGVPFEVGEEPRTCIVLRSSRRPFPELQPVEVTLPVGYPVEGFWFLHGSAYTGGNPVALYQIQYTDGSVHDIPLINNENIRDWAGTPGPFPRESATRSRVAWTGTTKIFPVVAVYQMLWVNPHPEKTVQAVRFANPSGSACPVLIALTAVVGEDFSEPEIPADVARRGALYLQARERFDAEEYAQALELLEAVLEMDLAYEPAHHLRGQIMERQHDEDGALEAYRRWTEAGARTPLPYNRIGEILERREDYRGALEAYERSLEIEWNQPPIISGRSRLSELLGR